MVEMKAKKRPGGRCKVFDEWKVTRIEEVGLYLAWSFKKGVGEKSSKLLFFFFCL